MSTNIEPRSAEVAPEYLRTSQIRKLVGVSAPTFRRVVYTHADFPVPVRLSEKLILWPVEPVRRWFLRQEVEGAARPKDKAGMPVAPRPSLRGTVDARRKKSNTPPSRRAKKPASRSASAR